MSNEDSNVPTDRAPKSIEIDVTYHDGEPVEAEYYHITWGLMRFTIQNGVAVVDDRWDELECAELKDGYEPQVKTPDVIYSVQQLPFIDEVQR